MTDHSMRLPRMIRYSRMPELNPASRELGSGQPRLLSVSNCATAAALKWFLRAASILLWHVFETETPGGSGPYYIENQQPTGLSPVGFTFKTGKLGPCIPGACLYSQQKHRKFAISAKLNISSALAMYGVRHHVLLLSFSSLSSTGENCTLILRVS